MGLEQKGGISYKSMGTGKAVIPNKLVNELYQGKYFRATWPGSPNPVCSDGNGYSDPSGGNGDINIGHFPGPFPLGFAYYLGGAKTVVAPIYKAAGAGLLANLENGTSGAGVEYLLGAQHDQTPDANNPLAIAVASGRAGFIRVKTKIATVNGQTAYAVGFRKAEAFQANPDDYDAMAVLDVISGDINVGLIVSGEATTYIDTTKNWLDGETHEFEVHSLGQQIRMFVDGAEVYNRQHWLSGETIVPVVKSRQGLATSSDVLWKEIELGELWLKEEDPNFR